MARIGREQMADSVQVKSIRLDGPQVTGGDWRAVVKGVLEGGELLVAFGGGSTPREALADMKRRSEEQGLRWREDKPFPGQSR
jgi:hypothetical protein